MMEVEIKKATKTAGAGPSSAMTIDKTIYKEDPIFDFTRAAEIKNLIRIRYNKDWSGLGKIARFGDFIGELEKSDSTSITKYGELPEDIDLSAVYLPDMADDVAGWHLREKKDIVPTVPLSCNRLVRKLERGDYFVLNDTHVAVWEGDLWKVVEIREVPELQRFEIKAIRTVSP
jgi:hypothetical protein